MTNPFTSTLNANNISAKQPSQQARTTQHQTMAKIAPNNYQANFGLHFSAWFTRGEVKEASDCEKQIVADYKKQKLKENEGDLTKCLDLNEQGGLLVDLNLIPAETYYADRKFKIPENSSADILQYLLTKRIASSPAIKILKPKDGETPRAYLTRINRNRPCDPPNEHLSTDVLAAKLMLLHLLIPEKPVSDFCRPTFRILLIKDPVSIFARAQTLEKATTDSGGPTRSWIVFSTTLLQMTVDSILSRTKNLDHYYHDDWKPYANVIWPLPSTIIANRDLLIAKDCSPEDLGRIYWELIAFSTERLTEWIDTAEEKVNEGYKNSTADALIHLYQIRKPH